MNYEEYKERIKALEAEFESKKVDVTKQFVRLNNPHKINEVVTDHMGSVLIEKIGYTNGFMTPPYAIYTGLVLKKDGTPTKKKERRFVHQINLLK